MERIHTEPRPDWQRTVEKQGLLFHTSDELVLTDTGNYRAAPKFAWRKIKRAYWDETACYAFSLDEITAIETATNELHAMCLAAVQYVIDNRLYPRLRIPEQFAPMIERSWDEDWPSVYGRFDLCVQPGARSIKLLEYNADTPTSLLEAAVIQWFWLQDKYPSHDQFNSLHERLIACWKRHRGLLPYRGLHFAHVQDLEDEMTVGYLRDTAEKAGFRTSAMWIEEIGWDSAKNRFVDPQEKAIGPIFKLYPWEWMVREEFSAQLLATADQTRWIEPAWKMVLSNKAILPLLWELNPGHRLLLECYEDGPRGMQAYVKKPIFAREGSNVSIVAPGVAVQTGGDYGEEGYIYQAYAGLPAFQGYRPVIGSWVVDGEAAGMGIRESAGLVTDNTSRFAPHFIV
ncbi:glutathionylspermidine synthase family protein [Candidatus Uhrbacteria bacterium]|nr:glutathionylspermidine synthase family protein [Candidatus Uhrbacteria bacterium]